MAQWVEQFQQRFGYRADTFLIGHPHPEKPTKRRWQRITGPLDADVLKAHIDGSMPLAVYPTQPDGTTKVAIVDFDSDDPNADVDKVLEAALVQAGRWQAAGLASYVERSRSGRGYHVWAFFDQFIAAEELRGRLWDTLLQDSPFFCRFYPANPKASDYGLAIALPFAGDAKDRGGCQFLDPTGGGHELLKPKAFFTRGVVNQTAALALLPMSQVVPIGDRNAPGTPGRSLEQAREQLVGAFKLISPFGCQFMQHAWVDRRTLAEPEWYVAIQQATAIRHGRAFAHALSRDYPGYRPGEVNAKYDQALRNPIAGCAYIHEHFPQHACQDCPHRFPYQRAERSLLQIAAGVEDEAEPIGDFGEDIALVHRYDAGDEQPGVPFPLPGLESVLRLRRGELTIFGAPPSMGKTTVMIDASSKLAAQGIPTVVCSAETGERALRTRYLANQSGIELSLLRGERGRRLQDDEWAEVRAAGARMGEWPLYLDYTAMTPDQVLALVEQVVLKGGFGLDTFGTVFFDYLQFAWSEGTEGKSEYERVSATSRGFKLLPKVLNWSAVVFSQLTRQAEDEEKPTMSLLRGSGRIEADADNIIVMSGERADGRVVRRFVDLLKQREGRANVRVEVMVEQPTFRVLDCIGDGV